MVLGLLVAVLETGCCKVGSLCRAAWDVVRLFWYPERRVHSPFEI